ncbi:MAG: hypothetical protein JRM80_03870 [Nitrososphaerota archaeon]|nr:hypothetical protein [Nitrososphaerota archaeon]
MTEFGSILPRDARRSPALIAVILLGLSIPAAALVTTTGATAALNIVQVTVQTTKDLPYQYTLTAYNTSGYQVASFNGNYPEAGFGLPSGTYLITAAAYYQQNYPPCYPCPLGAAVNSTTIPIRFNPPASEYGYAVEKVTGSTQVTVDTQNDSSFPLTSTPVHVSFFNGTAAAGASVSAYVVGMGYGYGEKWVSYGQTGQGGNFTLVMPNAPVEVSAYLTVPVQLPKGEAMVPVEIGGQTVNVTVYWQPYQVQLAGQALILPPQRGADIALKVQQYPYPVYFGSPGTVQSGVTTFTVTSTSGSAAQAAPSAVSGKISPFSPTSAQLSVPAEAAPGPSIDPATMLIFAVGAGAVAVAVFVAAMISGRKKQTVQSARP